MGSAIFVQNPMSRVLTRFPNLQLQQMPDRRRRRFNHILEDERWREGAADKNYGKKEKKEWLDNTLPDPHPCTAGNKEEEHTCQ